MVWAFIHHVIFDADDEPPRWLFHLRSMALTVERVIVNPGREIRAGRLVLAPLAFRAQWGGGVAAVDV